MSAGTIRRLHLILGIFWTAMTARLARFVTPARVRSAHGLLALFWTAMVLPTVLVWSESVKYLVFLSVYGVLVGHLIAFATSGAEARQEEHMGRVEQLAAAAPPDAAYTGGRAGGGE